MQLTLDHLILRAADPQATLAELADRLGAPVLAEVEEVAGLASGILRAGALDLEVLRVGGTPPAPVCGYGLGFTADAPLAEVSADLRRRGYPTSVPARATADGRTWRALQVQGLLPDPFPVPATIRKPGLIDRVSGAAAGLLTRVPPLAKAATRNAGRTMAVVTEYEFDADAWRTAAGHGPEPLAIEVGTAGYDWSKLPLAPSPLELRANGAAGITRIVFEGDGESFTLGDVEFDFSSAA
ncbi:VOC family protein [Solirubrobacter soli]|uniref:VOC family protein n=1 Tax=Solirubrobacter soli TaxID=363832 RepID=UPI00042902D8|nr:hypothetical protein [Solirubrobacter soli]